MQVTKFFNFSDEDFSWKFDGNLYTFKAGQEMYMEDYKAEHFAKHLIDRELDKQHKRTSDILARKELLLKCLSDQPSVPKEEIIDANVKKEEEKLNSSQEEPQGKEVAKEKKKLGRPKKAVEEFAALKQGETT